MRLVVFGGNGYVGQRVVASALKMGVSVLSISRTGAPDVNSKGMKVLSKVISSAPNNANVQWIKGDIFNPIEWNSHILSSDDGSTVDGAVSCIGAFGSNEFMEKINGDANCSAISESLKANIPRFVFLSTVENTLPNFVLSGYFNGKRRAEQALLDAYPDSGTVLRPSFIYGCRDIPGSSISIPLGSVGKILETAFTTIPGASSIKSIPGLRAIAATPVSVENVGLVAAAAAIIPKVLTTDVNHDIYQLSGILNEDDITFKAKQLLSDSIYDLIATKIQNSSDSKISQTNKEEKEQVEDISEVKQEKKEKV